MTQKDKELLLKDLCARLPHGVFINFEKTHNIFPLASIKMEEMFPLNDFQVLLNDKYPIQWCKPYLRPMSSMTDEEIEIYRIIIKSLLKNSVTDNIATLYNFLNSKHLDYNGLIPLGLAIEVTEENNPYK